MKKVHHFMGYGRVPSSCIIHKTELDDIHLILFQNTGDGTSVTNASEQLATEIVNELELNPKECRFFEYYGEWNKSGGDEITYDWEFHDQIWKAQNPKWHFKLDEKIRKVILEEIEL